MSSGSYLYERAQNHYRFNQRMRIAGLEIQGSLAASFFFFRRWLWVGWGGTKVGTISEIRHNINGFPNIVQVPMTVSFGSVNVFTR